MKTTLKSRKSKQRKSTQKKIRVAPFRSILQNQTSGAAIRKYLTNYSTFLNYYRNYYPYEDITERIKFLKTGPENYLQSIDDDLILYSSPEWRDMKYIIFIVPIIEEYFRHYKATSLYLKPAAAISNNLFIKDDLLTYSERVVIYLKYVLEFSDVKIKKICGNNYYLLNYLPQTMKKLRKAFRLEDQKAEESESLQCQGG